MEHIELDHIDIHLLDLLQRDASLSNNALADLAKVSPPTSLRRIKRLRELGVIERDICVLNPDRLAPALGHGLTALVEISLDQQSTEALDRFEARVVADDAVQQCYRVSPGPDFVLVLHCADMPAYLALTQRMFTTVTNVRNVKTFFSVKRAKFAPSLPLHRAPR